VDFDPQVIGSPARYGDELTEDLLLQLLPAAEEVVGQAVYPTYSYARVYQHGAVLKRHRDREACEISLSLNLSCRGQSTWPFWIEGPLGVSSVRLKPGDALFYHGIECSHWRHPFRGTQCVQVFLHYVAQDGPHASWRYDRRRVPPRHRTAP